jgi:hypothetical protein
MSNTKRRSERRDHIKSINYSYYHMNTNTSRLLAGANKWTRIVKDMMHAKTLNEPDCLMDILHSVKICQSVLAGPFASRGRIQDRAIYWAVARVQFSLEALASLIETKLKQ